MCSCMRMGENMVRYHRPGMGEIRSQMVSRGRISGWADRIFGTRLRTGAIPPGESNARRAPARVV